MSILYLPRRLQVLSAVLAAFLLTPSARAQWVLVKIADGDTPIPGVQGETFDVFSAPAISGERVAFYGRSGDFHNANQVGIFSVMNGSFEIVADMFTPVPNPTAPNVKFTRFGAPSISGEQIAFWGQNHFGPLHEGIYVGDGGPLHVVADVNTPIPSGMGTFSSQLGAQVGAQAIDSGNVAFKHDGPGQGVYAEIGGDLVMVANLNTQIPGGQGTFTPPSGSLPFDEVSISGASVAFVGRGVEQEGIYSTIGGLLKVEVDLNTVLPGGGGKATLLRGPSLDGEDLTFYANGTPFSQRSGIFLKQGGTLRVVADSQTVIPGRPWFFSIFGFRPALDNGNVVFFSRPASPNPYEGIFALYLGELVKVVDTDDELDGKQVLHLDLGPQAVSGSRIAFMASFTDFSEAVYVAISPLFFRDGFESGDTSAWFMASPPPTRIGRTLAQSGSRD